MTASVPGLAPGEERRARAAAYAFFDVDETVISFKSMFSFQDYWYQHGPAEPGAGRDHFHAVMRDLTGSGAPREEVNRRYYEFYAGRSAQEVGVLARRWFDEQVKSAPAAYREPVVGRLRRHQSDGVVPVFVSGSLLEILAPLADELRVDDLLCTRLETVDGRFTGRILPPQMIGDGKTAAVRDFIRARGAAPARCHAYGDDISDAGMLECVGQPHAVAGSPQLESYATARGWDVLG